MPAKETAVAHLLRERIRANGPIAFAEWMQTALYHPRHGYYRRDRPTVGPDGDFLTSPEVHPIFGAAVACAVADAWDQLGRPDPFRVVEIGPGTGALAESVLRQLDGPLASAASLRLVEQNRFATARQCDRLAAFGCIEWADDPSRLAPGSAHLIIANELLDALPVHRLIYGESWLDLRVGWNDDRGFHDVPSALSDPSLAAPLSGVRAVPGQIAEVSPARAEMIGALADLLGAGRMLLFDYGYPRPRLYAQHHRGGTLATARRHVPGDDPYARPGEQDLTAHIDLDQVREAALAAGLAPLPVITQADWLGRLAPRILAKGDLAARRALEQLRDPDGLGRIAVMGFARP